jgi:hypothetical protein
MTMVLKLSIVVMILVLLFDVAEATVLPANSPNVNRCSVIDATRPPQFIVYESKFESQIRLRLRNNSSCAIVVETDDEYPIQLNLVCEFLDFRRIQVSSSEDLASTQTKLKDSDVPTTRSPAMSAASFSMRLWQHYDRKAKSIAGSRLLQLPWHKRYL